VPVDLSLGGKDQTEGGSAEHIGEKINADGKRGTYNSENTPAALGCGKNHNDVQSVNPMRQPQVEMHCIRAVATASGIGVAHTYDPQPAGCSAQLYSSMTVWRLATSHPHTPKRE